MMMRKQARIGAWMAAMSVAATAAMTVVPAAGQDWGADEDGSRAVVSDGGIELVDPPSPEGTGSSPTPSFAAGPIDGRGFSAVDSSLPYDSSATVVDDGGSDGNWTGWMADACRYPRDQGPFEQPGLLQVLRDQKCATWTFRSDALLLWRNSPNDIPLYSYTANTPNGYGATALSAGQLESTTAAGPRFSIYRTDDCQNAWETTWFKAANFRSQEATLPSINGYGMTPPGLYGNAFTPVDTATADLSASIWSFELNRWARVRPNIALMQGFRMLGWGENLTLLDHYQIDPTNPAPIYGQDVFGNQCSNSLYGYQIGTDIRLWDRGQGFRLDGLLKGGAYYNNAVQNSAYTYEVAPGELQTANVRAAGGSAAFVGEVGLTGTLPITCNLSLRVGYLGLWLQGLAQPTNQLRGQTLTSGGPGSPVAGSLNTAGSTVVQGLSLGLEGRW